MTGIDSFDPYYHRPLKENNVRDAVTAAAGAGETGRFTFVEGDVTGMDLEPYFDGCDAVFHLAARPGVRESWGRDFTLYDRNNILGTQRVLLAAASLSSPPRRMVFASSSSVYGSAQGGASREDDPLRPASPYGVTKLCCEHLCRVHADAFGLSVVMLRYFTVYGPRQRPDMGIQRFIAAALSGEPVTLFGGGDQVRDFTYVDDAVEATVRAATSDRIPAGVAFALNAGAGSPATLKRVIDLVGAATRRRLRVEYGPPQPGDVDATMADTSLMQRVLGFRPATPLPDGIAAQVSWAERAMGGEGRCPAGR